MTGWKRGPDCPPAIQLEQLVAGEEVSADVRQHLPGCVDCEGYFRTLSTEQEDFRRRRPADVFVSKLDRKSATSRPVAWVRWLGVVLAMTALVVVVRPDRLVAGDEHDITFKGSPFVVTYLREGMKGPRAVADDMELRAGDALRFIYRAPTNGYFAVLDLDGRGEATVLHPFGQQETAPLAEGRVEPLSRSIVLDDSVGPELLVAVFAQRPLSLPPLLTSLREHPPGQLPVRLPCEGCEVHVLRIRKGR